MARDASQLRGTRAVVDGRELAAFAGCSYLGLAHHPEVLEALRAGAERYGVSSGASRATTGGTLAHAELERELAAALDEEAALLLPEGALASQALLLAVAPRVRHALLDARSHPTLEHAARAAGLALARFPAGDAQAAAQLARERADEGVAVLTDGVFPLWARVAPLRALREALPPEALLVVDDCHGFGVLGERGRGAPEHAGLPPGGPLLTGTLAKAFGCYGGFVAGPREVVERVRATPLFVGTTPLPPALAEAARAALRIGLAPERRAALRANVARLRAHLEPLGVPLGDPHLPVVPLTTGAPQADARLERALRERGFLVPRVDYPGGPDGGALRLALSAAHAREEVDGLGAALAALWPAVQAR